MKLPKTKLTVEEFNYRFKSIFVINLSFFFLAHPWPSQYAALRVLDEIHSEKRSGRIKFRQYFCCCIFNTNIWDDWRIMFKKVLTPPNHKWLWNCTNVCQLNRNSSMKNKDFETVYKIIWYSGKCMSTCRQYILVFITYCIAYLRVSAFNHHLFKDFETLSHVNIRPELRVFLFLGVLKYSTTSTFAYFVRFFSICIHLS